VEALHTDFASIRNQVYERQTLPNDRCEPFNLSGKESVGGAYYKAISPGLG
jgi:hypothetical protein